MGGLPPSWAASRVGDLLDRPPVGDVGILRAGVGGVPGVEEVHALVLEAAGGHVLALPDLGLPVRPRDLDMIAAFDPQALRGRRGDGGGPPTPRRERVV